MGEIREAGAYMKPFTVRMLESAKRRESRVVLALDISGPIEERLARAASILERTRSAVAAVKLNHHLLLPLGLEGVKSIIIECREEGLPLIADLKLNDIESTNMNVAESLLHYGFDALIASPLAGSEEGLGKVVQRFHAAGSGILLLVHMSHRGAEETYSLQTSGGEPLYRLFARWARSWGVDGVVVSAKSGDRIAEVRQIVGRECLVFSPGVGAQGGMASEAMSSGADFIMVGRGITEASDPAKAAMMFRRQGRYETR